MSPIAALLTAAVLAVPVSPQVPVWHPEGCEHQHGSKVAYSGLGKALRHTRAEVDKPRVRDLWVCTTTRPKAHALHRHALGLWKWRKRPPQAWWIRFHRHPMPYCTWGPESGGNYRARNSSSSAGGKYQIIDSTWFANGGSGGGSHPAADASPLEQERVARNVLASSGPGAWVNC